NGLEAEAPFRFNDSTRLTVHAPDSSVCAPSDCSSASSSAASASCASIFSLHLIAAANRPVNRPPLRSVLRKNSQVGGWPLVPLVSAVIQPATSLVYSGLPNGFRSHEAVLVIR